MLGFMLAMAVLLVGSLFLSVVYESIAGNQSFSLPFANILLVTVVGGALYPRFGFRSTGVVLVIYALWCVVGGLLERRTS